MPPLRFLRRCPLARNCLAPLLVWCSLCQTFHTPWQRHSWVHRSWPRPLWLRLLHLPAFLPFPLAPGEQVVATVRLTRCRLRQKEYTSCTTVVWLKQTKHYIAMPPPQDRFEVNLELVTVAGTEYTMQANLSHYEDIAELKMTSSAFCRQCLS